MRTTINLLAAALAGTALAVPAPAPAADAEIDPNIFTDPYSLAAALPTLAAEGEAFVSGYAPYAAGYLSEAVAAAAPTARISDIPALLSSAEPLIEGYAGALATQVAAGQLPPDVVEQIPAAIDSIVPAIESAVDAVAAQLPGTLSLAAVPGIVATAIPAIESALEAEVDAALPVISSYLTQYASLYKSVEAQIVGGAAATGVLPLPTGMLNATVTPTGYVTALSPSGATTSPIAVATAAGAVRGEAWTGGVVGVVGAVVALGML